MKVTGDSRSRSRYESFIVPEIRKEVIARIDVAYNADGTVWRHPGELKNEPLALREFRAVSVGRSQGKCHPWPTDRHFACS
jgi:hypothetical protein